MNTHYCSASDRRLFACEDGRRLCAPVAAARPRDRHTRASLGVVDLEARPGPAAAPGASQWPSSVRVASRGRRPAREIATRELRSEWSISKPGQALPPPA